MFFIGLGIVIFFVTWLLFINLMPLKDREFKWYIKYPIILLFAIGYILDVIFNILWGTCLFLQMPYRGTGFNLTFSQRLRRILRGDTLIAKGTFRYKMAMFFCRYMIEPWDKNHCGLEDIK